jgi:hypothetical protein
VGKRFRDTCELPDGYRWDGDGPGIVLIDPEWCPANVHPFVIRSRDGVTHCTNPDHPPHCTWTCICGEKVYRFDRAFWGGLQCIPPRPRESGRGRD